MNIILTNRILELSGQRLTESSLESFFDSPDKDWPSSKESLGMNFDSFNKGIGTDGGEKVILFREGEKYTEEGFTHELVSHAIKHMYEFSPKVIKEAINSTKGKIEDAVLSEESEIFILDKKDGIVATQEEALMQITDAMIVNTYDRIHDKVSTGKNLSDLERSIYQDVQMISDKYEKRINTYKEKAVNVEQRPELIPDLLKNNRLMLFYGLDRTGRKTKLYYSPLDTGILIITDMIKSFFRIDKENHRNHSAARDFLSKKGVSDNILKFF